MNPPFEPLIIVYFSYTPSSLSHTHVLGGFRFLCGGVLVHAIRTTSTYIPWQPLLCSTHSFFYPFFFLARCATSRTTAWEHFQCNANILAIILASFGRYAYNHIVHGSMDVHLRFEETFGTRFQCSIGSVLLSICQAPLYGLTLLALTMKLANTISVGINHRRVYGLISPSCMWQTGNGKCVNLFVDIVAPWQTTWTHMGSFCAGQNMYVWICSIVLIFYSTTTNNRPTKRDLVQCVNVT